MAQPANRCIDDKLDLAVLDHIDDMGPSLGHLIDKSNVEATIDKYLPGAPRGNEVKAEVRKLFRDEHNIPLVFVLY